MPKTILSICVMLSLAGCGYHVDGAYEVTSGSPPNYVGYEQLVEGKTTKAEAVKVMGTGGKVLGGKDGSETIQYEYSYERNSYVDIVGVRHSNVTQAVSERVELAFREGILFRKERFFDVKEN